LNFNANKGLRYAISFDGGVEQIVNVNQKYTEREFEGWQANHINQNKKRSIQLQLQVCIVLRIRVLEPGIVLQKIIIDTGGLKNSYLGAPESKLSKKETGI
jgi:hypothetical protein